MHKPKRCAIAGGLFSCALEWISHGLEPLSRPFEQRCPPVLVAVFGDVLQSTADPININIDTKFRIGAAV